VAAFTCVWGAVCDEVGVCVGRIPARMNTQIRCHCNAADEKEERVEGVKSDHQHGMES